jgi:predicted transcriptional regulator
MLEHLFGSKTRVKILKLLYRRPDRAFFVRELSREIGVQINAIRRELELLLSLGIILEKIDEKPVDAEKAGSTLRKYYHLNPESLLYTELQALLVKETIIEQKQFIEDLSTKIGDIKLLILTGAFTNDHKVTTDLLVVGVVKLRALAKLIEQYQRELGFDIRYTIMEEDEFADRRYVMDKFLYSIFEAEHIKVVDRLNQE